MAENKTQRTDNDVHAFLESVDNQKRREDGKVVLELMEDITGLSPEMWGPSIIGFGSYHYKYDSGREGDMPLIGFSPRKQSLSLYIMAGFDQYDELMAKLGKHTLGKSCLYIKKLEDVDMDVLKELVKQSYDYTKEYYSK